MRGAGLLSFAIAPGNAARAPLSGQTIPTTTLAWRRRICRKWTPSPRPLSRYAISTTHVARGAAMQGRSTEGKNLPPVPASSFERVALPVAKKKNLGVIAMKVTAQENLVGEGPGKSGIEPLLRYALSLPVSVAVVGMPKLGQIRQNTAIARSFTPMPTREMRDFSRRMADANKVAMDRYFCCHEDVRENTTGLGYDRADVPSSATPAGYHRENLGARQASCPPSPPSSSSPNTPSSVRTQPLFGPQ